MKLLVVDAFTNLPFAGNSAAVCLLEEVRDADWMQAVAAEMNVSETAFVRRLDDDFELRWFTPAIEVELCGHATLASAHALWTEGVVKTGQPIRFHTKTGVLTCTQAGNLIELDFPTTPAKEAKPPAGLLDALGLQPTFVGRSQFGRFLAITSEQAVWSLKPDFAALRKISMRGVIVTSPTEMTAFQASARGGVVRVRVTGDRVLLGGQAVTVIRG